jgi:exosortase/archaeosortase family protein
MQRKHFSDQAKALALNYSMLAGATKLLVIVVVVVAFYFQDLNLVFSNSISDEATYHILAIPFLFGYLLYRKRRMVGATLKQGNQNIPSALVKNFDLIAGSLLCATAILAYWFGSYTFTPIEYHMLTMPVLTAGLVLILFNGQTLKQLAFPILFLFFLTPPPTEILYSIGSTLSDLSAQASNALANTLGMASTISTQYGSPIITLTRPDQTIMSFSVDVACSGVYSLIGFFIFAAFIAYITRGKLWNKLAILAMGIPLIIGLNIIRITTILGLGYNYGDALALEVFHSLGATVLMFVGTLILLVVTEKFVKKPKPPRLCSTCNPTTEGEFCSRCGKIFRYPKIRLSKSDLAKIASIAIAIGILISIQAPVFALTEGPAEILVQTPSGNQPNTQNLPLPQISGYNLSYVYRDSNFEKLSGEDASLVYAYTSTNNPPKPTVWVSVELASTTGPLHRWETCLVNYPLSQGMQPSVTQIDLTDTQIQNNPPVTARFFAFQYHVTNQTQTVIYWYETATFTVNGSQQQKHVKMSLVAYPKSADEVPEYEAMLLPIAQTVNDHWQPIKTWTTIALTISQNGLTLSATTTGLLVAFIIYRIFLSQQEKASLLTLYNKLPTKNQLLNKAVQNAKKHGIPTIQGIANELNNLTNATINLELLEEELLEAEKIVLIEKKVVNKFDEPAYSWRSLLPEQGSVLFLLRFFK